LRILTEHVVDKGCTDLLLPRGFVFLHADVELGQRGCCGAMQLALLTKILETQCPSIFTSYK
jgi:hypothetical protein